MVDVAVGTTDLDDAMANLLRVSKKPVFLAVNKVDNSQRALEATEFYSLGFDEIYTLSSISGTGTGELLDAVVANIPDELETESKETSHIPKLAIIVQPKVGKSSLRNALVGQERTIVSNVAGTTRDTIHTHYNLFNKECILIDTAGIRKKNTEKDDLEF
jgi:GTP-binding protein